jgi:DNA-binding transcriptional LysR family regulator
LKFVASAKRILDDVDIELRRIKSRRRGELGLLTIGVQASPSAGHMHAMLVEYHRRFPDVDVRTVDGRQVRLLCALAGNAALFSTNPVDIAIMTVQATAWDRRLLPLWSERVIVSFPQHYGRCQNFGEPERRRLERPLVVSRDSCDWRPPRRRGRTTVALPSRISAISAATRSAAIRSASSM